MMTETATMNRVPPRDPPWVMIAATAWVLIFAIVCGRSLLSKKESHSVYPVFASAGKNWINGEELYVRGRLQDFRYSPLVAAFFAPFDQLPTHIGEVLWRTLNFGVYAAGLYLCCQLGLPRKLTANQKAAVFLLVLPISVGSLNNAQSNPLIIGLMLLSVGWVMLEQWMLAAMAIAVAAMFKIYPLTLGMLLVLLYPKKFSWRLLVMLLLGALLPFLMQRADYVRQQYVQWVSYLTGEHRDKGSITDWYRDFRAVWRVYVGSISDLQYTLVQLATAAMIAGVCLAGRLRQWQRPTLLALMLSLACCWMTVFGPATESATYILLAPAVAWGLVESFSDPTARWRRIIYSGIFALFIVSELAVNLGELGSRFRDYAEPLALAGLVLFVMLMVEAGGRFIFHDGDNRRGFPITPN
jgi:Glycosyltransferase family 87